MSEFDTSHPSLVVTGMSAAGKSTLIGRILECPAYSDSRLLHRVTTRGPRQSDLPGEYEYVSHDGFMDRFHAGDFLEPTLWHAEMGPSLYGSPTQWLRVLRQGGQIVSPPSIAVADRIKQRLGESVAWVHLYADDDIKERRLTERGHTDQEIAARLTVYEDGCDGQLRESDLNIDTGFFNVEESFLVLGAFSQLVDA